MTRRETHSIIPGGFWGMAGGFGDKELARMCCVGEDGAGVSQARGTDLTCRSSCAPGWESLEISLAEAT